MPARRIHDASDEAGPERIPGPASVVIGEIWTADAGGGGARAGDIHAERSDERPERKVGRGEIARARLSTPLTRGSIARTHQGRPRSVSEAGPR